MYRCPLDDASSFSKRPRSSISTYMYIDRRIPPHGGGYPPNPKPEQTAWGYSYSAAANSVNAGFGYTPPWGGILRSTYMYTYVRIYIHT